MPRSEVKIEKIDDGAEANSIDDIADRATDDQPDRDGEERARRRGSANRSSTATIAAATSENSNAFTPAPPLNNPKLMPRL